MTSLEYLHSRGYTHNDVKAQNLLLDSSGCDVYLVDFGLASKYKVPQSSVMIVHLCNNVFCQDNLGFHHDGDEDERFAHEGTLEYTSRDGHIGAHSRLELSTNLREVSHFPEKASTRAFSGRCETSRMFVASSSLE